jgi:hypothetical protein
MLFASGGSDDDGYGGYDDDVPYEEPPPQSTRRAPGAQRGGGSGNGGGSGSGGRQRSIQFQPEERYWTEYLRIALPIIGLLLMIGLFWFWASQLTSDDNGGDEPIATTAPGVADLITPESTPQPTQQVVVPPTSAPAEDPPPSTPAEEAPPPEEEPVEEEPADEEPAEEEPAAGGFEIDQSVVVTEDGLNMRDDSTTAGEIVTTLDAGAVLTIQDGPVEGDSYTWYQVIVEETGELGWVADDFIEAAE